MTSPIPVIDPRHFQDIVDEAKRRIVQYCPEWTDHNVSDPGITLIELFAWMTDLIRFRLNNVPERDYRQFLKLIGARPRPAIAARTELIFWLSAAQKDEKIIPHGTEVTIQQTAAQPAVTFSTDADLAIHVPELAYCVQGWVQSAGPDGVVYRDVSEALERNNAQLSVFQARPMPGDALYLGFKENLGGHVIRLNIRCQLAMGFNIIPDDPPILWEFWDGASWQSLLPDPDDVPLMPLTESEQARFGMRLDSTAGLNETGSALLLIPRTSTMRPLQVGGQPIEACWIRVRAYHRDPAQPFYNSSPVVEGFEAESIGGMVVASHTYTVVDEELGRSDGSSGQSFYLSNPPILPRESENGVTETVVMERSDGVSEAWQEVDRFGNSTPVDSHFMLDDLTGEVRFGPGVRDPAGQERQYGRVPPSGYLIRFSKYRSGGGSLGNVGRGTLVVPISSANLDYVKAVFNLRPAVGGRDGETLDELLVHGPDLVRTRDVAVTKADFEELVRHQFPQVADVQCVAGMSNVPGEVSTGQHVRVILVPVLPAASAPLDPENVALGQAGLELCRNVHAYLEERCMMTTELAVTFADYQWVSVSARLSIRQYQGLAPFELEVMRLRIREEAERRLYRLLHPSIGGPDGKGWPFGRSLTQGDVFPLLESIPGVKYVDHVGFRPVTFEAGRSILGSEDALIQLRSSQVLCSDTHEIVLVAE